MGLIIANMKVDKLIKKRCSKQKYSQRCCCYYDYRFNKCICATDPCQEYAEDRVVINMRSWFKKHTNCRPVRASSNVIRLLPSLKSTKRSLIKADPFS